MQIRPLARRERMDLSNPEMLSLSPLQQIRQTMESMFSDLFREPSLSLSMMPPVNMKQEGDNLVIECAVPGYTKDQIDITCTRDMLTIKAEIKGQGEQKDADFLAKEWHRAGFLRTIPLPFDVDASQVKAKMENGMLKITVPQHEEARRSQIHVRVD